MTPTWGDSTRRSWSSSAWLELPHTNPSLASPRACRSVSRSPKARTIPVSSYAAGSFHAWYEPSVRSDGANSARCISARAQRRSLRFAATSA